MYQLQLPSTLNALDSIGLLRHTTPITALKHQRADTERPRNQRHLLLSRALSDDPFLLAVSSSCSLRLFLSALTDFVADVRDLLGDVGSSFFTTRRCD
jgi:hypothetical protein